MTEYLKIIKKFLKKGRRTSLDMKRGG